MSNSMLYNEIKAEQEFLTLINATISHELRNPLSSIIGQREKLEELMKGLQETIKMLGDHKVTKILKKIEQGFQDCTRKIVSASKFIDYFVHDMLDYTILSKNENFTKTLETFDVRNSVNEIVEILEDKIQMKEIKISVNIKVDDVLITTD